MRYKNCSARWLEIPYVTSHLSLACIHFISFLEWGRGEGADRGRKTGRDTETYLSFQGFAEHRELL